jgi:hypothetical protein
MLLGVLLVALSAQADTPTAKSLNAKPLNAAPAPKAAPTFTDADCAGTKKKLALHAMGLRAYCATDDDCAAFQVDPSPCTRPEIFRKDAHVADDKDLTDLQEKVKAACSHVWAMAGACVPYAAKPVCREGKCEDAGGVAVPSKK